MKRNGRFWWFVTLIALAHLGMILLVSRWASAAREPEPQSITWLSGGGAPAATEVDEDQAVSSPEPVAAADTPTPSETPVSAAKSEIQLPSATPIPISKPTATRKPTPERSPTPRVRPTSTPKTRPTAKTSPVHKSSSASKKSTSPSAKGSGKTQNAAGKSAPAISSRKGAGQDKGAGEGSDAGTGTATKAAEFSWYGNMLHDRFYKEWVQPITVLASGAKFSARARIRIEKDGTVSDFKVSQPSGNMLVDESVVAAGGRVKRVDAVPAGLVRGDHYDVEVVFALNPQ